jgi:hypothetical protein
MPAAASGKGQWLSSEAYKRGGSASECNALSREAPLALPVKELLRPNNCTTRAGEGQFIEGEARWALPGEGATRAPLIGK